MARIAPGNARYLLDHLHRRQRLADPLEVP
jgi:hypothetical protein